MRRKLTTALAITLCLQTVHAQIGPGIEWQRCIGGTSTDFGYYVQQTSNGEFLVAGYASSSNGDITCSNGPGNGDGVAARLDSSGSIIWLNCLGNSLGFPQSEEALSALEFSNGQSFFFGQFDGPGRFNLDGTSSSLASPTYGRHGIVSSDSNIVIVDLSGDIKKFTPSGTPIWSRSNTFMYNIRNTPDGGFISVGTVNQVSFPNYGDGRITKRNSLGNTEWTQTIASPYAEDYRSVAVTADGGYVVCGRTYNPNVPGYHANSDIWVVKFNSAGSLLWERAFGGSTYDEGQSIVSTQDGGMVIAASVQSDDGDVLGFIGGRDFWALKLDSLGNIQWQRCLGGSGNETAWWVDATSDGGYVLAGYTSSNDNDVSGNHSSDFDIWVVKLKSEFTDSDSDGTPDWADLCANGPEPGTACNDGNALTAQDVITAACQCIGQPDADGDGVPDANDVCPGGPDPGQSCNDGDPLTALDAINANCQCAGQPDADGDGVPDANDACPGGPEPGQACNDGNPFTSLDSVTATCQCAGQPDADQDGTPDANDPCPLQAGYIPGGPCDDGNPFTANDVVSAFGITCLCQGVPDADGDGVPDTNDVCPGGPDPGQSCDDGSPLTAGDIVNGNCQCIGFPDNDQDGVPDANDPCPLQAGLIPGQPCDDGNPNTENDVVVTFGINCQCQGEFTTGMSSSSPATLRIVPNPSNGHITIESPLGAAGASLAIFDAYGQLVQRDRFTSPRLTLDLSHLAKGLYTVTIHSATGVAGQRLVLE